MGFSNAERQRRFRECRKEQQPRVHYRRPQDRRSRPQRWRAAVQTLVDFDSVNGRLDALNDRMDRIPYRPKTSASTTPSRRHFASLKGVSHA